MSGIGVVTNPRSRHNRRDPRLARRLSYVLGEKGELAAPGDLDALARTAASFRDRDIDVLCINGGDGTVHQTVTAMIRAYGDAPLPPVAVLRGGTMNIVADSVGVRVDAGTMLEAVTDAWAAEEPLPETTRRTLRIASESGVWYGFLSGNGIIARFLEVYYETEDPTPLDAAWLLARGSMSALVGGPLIRRLTRRWEGRVTVDGRQLEAASWTAVALGTIEQMGLGFRVFHLLDAHPDRLQVVGLSSSVAGLARELPSVYRGRGVRRPGNFTEAVEEVVLDADEPIALMIDGDFYTPAPPVSVTVGPPVRFLLPG